MGQARIGSGAIPPPVRAIKRRMVIKPDPHVRPKGSLDVAWHTDPGTPGPEWTADLKQRFVQAFFDGKASMKAACQATGVPYRAAVAQRGVDTAWAAQLECAHDLYREGLLEELRHRAFTDMARPANLIFEVKNQHPQYADVKSKEAARVNVAIAITDTAFGRGAQAAVVPAAGVRVLLPAGEPAGSTELPDAMP